MKNIYFVILSGGHGTRLWPLSRKNRPKPLLPFLNNKSLLEETIDRVKTFCGADGSGKVGVVSTQEQSELITSAVGEKLDFMITEPSGRNTGPAILYSCFKIMKSSLDTTPAASLQPSPRLRPARGTNGLLVEEDATLVFLAADHFIPDAKKYCSYLEKAIEYASTNNKIVTLGLMPTHPATGYGYIEADAKDCVKAGNVYGVKKFHEKPDREKAAKYVESGDTFWNLGMFVGKTHVFMDEFKAHAPEMFSCVEQFVKTGKNYDLSPSLSIDYAVMEKSQNISIIPCDFEWNDVGNLDVFLSIQQKYETIKHEIINIDSKNNIAKINKKTITFIGVDNLCVVEDGDVIVVAKRDEVEKIGKIAKKM